MKNNHSAKSGKNRLAKENSPYLLQHAENPVDWFAWGEEAFKEARQQNKLIFLSIGYSTCYWCHVMERESFSDLSTGQLMNDKFINIKVDREERPDVDEIYMTALQLMTRHGGWPISIFLTPDRKPFYGATYIDNSSFKTLMNNLSQLWESDPDTILAMAEQITRTLQKITQSSEANKTSFPPVKLIGQASKAFADDFDEEYGGFNGAPKFPQPSVLQFLMLEEKNRFMVERTLNAIARGGIHDHVGGGIHRYAVDTAWSTPHFEKMLYDQAQLLHAYAHAFKWTTNPLYQFMAEDIIAYLKQRLLDSTGLFYSAEDAETECFEGKTYTWAITELQEALDKKEWAFFERTYRLEEKRLGEREFSYKGVILQLKKDHMQLAKSLDLTFDKFINQLKKINKKLLHLRNQRQQPRLDDKIITSWNGLTIEALAYASEVFSDKRVLNMAERAGQALWDFLRGDRPLYHVMREGKVKFSAYLDDYATVILAFIALNQVTKKTLWFDRAIFLADTMIEELWSPSGRFYYSNPETDYLLTHYQQSLDGAMPSANSLALRALTKLLGTGMQQYTHHVEAILRSNASHLNRMPQALPYMLIGLYDYYIIEDSVSMTDSEKHLLSSSVVNVQANLLKDRIEKEEPLQLTIILNIEKGWHINTNKPSQTFLHPTTINIQTPDGKIKENIHYPEGHKIDSCLGNNLEVYSQTVEIKAELNLIELVEGINKTSLNISIIFQACNDKGQCLLPGTVSMNLPVNIKS
ncbi:DUF255 domain-containing protein [Legionella israelensis]|uniref:DUF255 domain-containing protein n=1 Tax=Legionella israelensis TaxID=454 RepID=A0AAX1EHC2_9GAMM|nr:DUF255 domain-containing protein [Legionella israelensis]QBR84483.1 DUF255 domain-containing protein [Legionella israelensis]